MDYSKLTDDELLRLANNQKSNNIDYSSLSDEELLNIANSTNGESVGSYLNNSKPKPTFAESHPFVASIPEAGKQFGTRSVKSVPEFARGVSDLVALSGDMTGLQGVSKFGRTNANFWQNLSNKIQVDPKYQGVKGLSSAATFLPTVLGSVGDQATNIATTTLGGAGGLKAAAQLGLKGATKAGLITAGTSIPNLAQEGQYLDKIQAFQQMNGRMPTAEELKQIQNVALGEKAINTALESVSDRLLFGKLFPEGAVTKNLKGVLKGASQQALTEAATEGMQEGVSIGAENLLGINQGNNLERLADSIAIGGVTGGIMGGAGSIAARNTQDTESVINPTDISEDVSAKVLDGGKVLYDSTNTNPALSNTPVVDNSNSTSSAFDALKTLSRKGVLPNNIERIAPNTMRKLREKQTNIDNSDTGVENKAISKIADKITNNINTNILEKSADNNIMQAESNADVANTTEQANTKAKTLEKIRKIAPKTAEKLENNNTENITDDEKINKLKDLENIYEKKINLINKKPINQQEKEKEIKTAAFEHAAKKREIIQGDSLEHVPGGLTSKELAKKKAYLNSNYAGKEVLVGNQEAKIVNNVYGKVKVQFKDGTTKVVEREAISNKPKQTNHTEQPLDMVESAENNNTVTADIEQKIAKLKKKIKIAGSNTVLGQKYQAQIDELRKNQATEQPATQANNTIVKDNNAIEETVSDSGMIKFKKGKYKAGIIKKSADKYEVILSELYPDSDTKYKILTPTFKRPTFKTEQEAREHIKTFLNNQDLEATLAGNVEYDSPDGLTLEEWLSKPRRFKTPEREMTLDEWRAKNGYPTPLDEGLDWVRNPKGDTATDLSFKKKRLEARKKSFDESLEEYNKLKQENKIPKISDEVYYRADGNDTDSTVAKATVYYKRNGKTANIDHALKKATYKTKHGQIKEFEYVETPPEGWVEMKGAMTAPKGYTWYSNNKSLLSGNRKTVLVKDNFSTENTDSNNRDTIKRRNDICYQILQRATGKPRNIIAMALNTQKGNKGALKRAESIEDLIMQPDDKITADGFPQEWKEFFSENSTDEELAQQALNYLRNNDKTTASQRNNAEYGTYLEQQYNEYQKEIENTYQDMLNSNSIEKRFEIFNNATNEIENKYKDVLLNEDFDRLVSLLNDENLQYNNDKEFINNDNKKQNEPNNGRLLQETPEPDGRTEIGTYGKKSSNDETNSGRKNQERETQQAIEGFESESQRTNQRNEDNYNLRIAKEKFSTTNKGNQQAMFNTEQFKNGQQMLIDTSDLNNGEASVDIPDFMNKSNNIDSDIKDVNLEPVYNEIKKGIKGKDLAKYLPKEIGEVINDEAQNYTFGELKTKDSKAKGVHRGKKATIELNLDAIGNNPYLFIKTLMHEIRHANQLKTYLQIMGKPKNTWTANERTFVAHYNICKKVNKERKLFYNKHKELIDKYDRNNFYSAEERAKAISQLSKKEQQILDKNDIIYDDYKNALFETEARAKGAEYAKGYRQESRHSFSRTSKTKSSNIGRYENRNLLSDNRFRTTEESSDIQTDRGRLGEAERRNKTDEKTLNNDSEYSIGLSKFRTKERGAIKTLNKYDEDMAKAVTDREYEVRGIPKVLEEIKTMSEKELDEVLNNEKISDIKTVALAQSIKSEIENGNVPISKLNKWAVEGTDIGQAMQSRRAIAPESVEEAIIKMHAYNTEKAPKIAKELLKDSDNIVNKIKETSNEEVNKKFNEWLKKLDDTPAKKQYSQDGDRLALLKAMERYRRRKDQQLINELKREEERKRKTVEQLITERTFGLDRKKRADLIDNILKLEANDGLTADNVCKLICKMYKIKEVNKTNVEELKKLSEDIKNAKTQRDEDIAKAKMQKYIIDNSIGSDIYNKIDTIRYINMLGGTTQRVLDFVSTGVYQIVRLADNTATLVLDKTASKTLGFERVTSGYYSSEWAKGFAQGASEGFYDTVNGLNTGRAGESARYDLNKPLAFSYKPLDNINGFLPKLNQGIENTFSFVEKFVNGMVKIPDRAYFSARYNTSLLEQMASRGVDVKKYQKLDKSKLSETLTNIATQEEVEQALSEARENVFQRDCAAAKMARNIRNAFNIVKVGGFKLGDWTFPFIHTTSVISEDIVDRIGLGFVKGCKDIYKIKTEGGTRADLRNAYNNIAKSIVGAIIISIGAMSGEDKEEESFTDKEMIGGHQKPINIGNISLNAKDIPFLTVPYRLGKLLMTNNEHKIKNAILETWDGIAETNPILSKYKENYSYANKSGDDILEQFIADSIGTTVGQLVQNSQLRNIRAITDPYERETYDPNSPIKTQINRFKNANPFTSPTLPYKYNAIGEKVSKTNIDNVAERTLSSLITGHRRLKDENATYSEYKRLGNAFKDTSYKGKNSLYMSKIKRSIYVNGEKYKMNPEEFSAFQRDYGRINYNIRSKMLNYNDFMNQDASSFVKDINELRSSIEEAVKIKHFGHKPKLDKRGNYKLHKYTEDILLNYDNLTE